jgi:hypothetical protein
MTGVVASGSRGSRAARRGPETETFTPLGVNVIRGSEEPQVTYRDAKNGPTAVEQMVEDVRRYYVAKPPAHLDGETALRAFSKRVEEWLGNEMVTEGEYQRLSWIAKEDHESGYAFAGAIEDNLVVLRHFDGSIGFSIQGVHPKFDIKNPTAPLGGFADATGKTVEQGTHPVIEVAIGPPAEILRDRAAKPLTEFSPHSASAPNGPAARLSHTGENVVGITDLFGYIVAEMGYPRSAWTLDGEAANDGLRRVTRMTGTIGADFVTLEDGPVAYVMEIATPTRRAETQFRGQTDVGIALPVLTEWQTEHGLDGNRDPYLGVLMPTIRMQFNDPRRSTRDATVIAESFAARLRGQIEHPELPGWRTTPAGWLTLPGAQAAPGVQAQLADTLAPDGATAQARPGKSGEHILGQ